MERREVIGSAGAGGAMVLVGSSVAAASVLVDYPIAGGQALRYGLGAALLFALARARLARLNRSQTLGLLALAASGLAGFNAFLIAAVREADAASVGVIVGCVPVTLALAGPLLERRPFSARVVAASVVVAVGAGAVQWNGGTMSLRGLALSLGALGCEAAFSLLAVPLLASLGPLAVSTYACLFAAPLLLASGLVLDGAVAMPLPSAEEAAALVYLAAMVTAAGFVLWYSGVERLGVERAGLFAGILPVSALLSAAAISASTITPLRLMGALAVGAAVTAGLTVRRQDRGTSSRAIACWLRRQSRRSRHSDGNPRRPMPARPFSDKTTSSGYTRGLRGCLLGHRESPPVQAFGATKRPRVIVGDSTRQVPLTRK